MNSITITWVLCYLGVLVYFLIKAKKLSADMTAANEDFHFTNFLKAEWFDIILALGLATLLLTTKKTIPGINIDFTDGMTSFVTGIGIASVGVNIFLGILGFGDKTRKRIRNTVDEKTGRR